MFNYQLWNNKVAVVTGASVGIGASVTINLANLGMTVIGIARRVELIDALNGQLNTESGQIIGRKCDITNEMEILELFNWIKEKYSRIDVFVNNAGRIKANFLMASPSQDIRDLFDVNCVAPCICIREALQLMRENGTKGHIFIVNSILGHRIPDVPVPLFSVYPSTKHAITALCQTIRQEIHFHKLNIKLTSISPGMVDTDFLSVYNSSAVFAQLPKLKADDVANAIIYALNTPEYVQVDEIVLQAMFRNESE